MSYEEHPLERLDREISESLAEKDAEIIRLLRLIGAKNAEIKDLRATLAEVLKPTPGRTSDFGSYFRNAQS